MKLLSLLFISLAASGATLGTGHMVLNGVTIFWETKLNPDAPPITKSGGGTLTENNIAKRHVCNFENNTYFGYDLTAQSIGDGRYRLRFSPLSITPEKMGAIFKDAGPWKSLALPKGEATMDVRANETIALDLFENPSTGQKVTDYITIKTSEQSHARMEGTARDFGVQDVWLTLSSPRISVDGKLVSSSGGGIAGPAVWMDLPSHGRFVFSLSPRPDLGMKKAGEIRGNEMTWSANGHAYKVTTAKPVTTGAGAYNLYVFHVAKEVTELALFAGDRPDDPIRSKR